MSKDSQEVRLLKEKAMGLKKEFEGEIDRIIQDIDDKKDAPKEGTAAAEEEKEDIKDYEMRLEGLKEELKNLKKIKKRQKKINKLEEEKVDVIKEIERRKNMERKFKGNKKHSNH